MKEAVTRLDYCQYLLASPIDYLLTNFADHSESFSHDQVNQYLGGEKVTPRMVWENVTSDVVETTEGYLVFDDTMFNKRYSFGIESVRR